MPRESEIRRNGRIRMTVLLAVLVVVGAATGWSTLLGWPALILALDVSVTGLWLLRHRSAAPARVVAPAAAGGAGG